MVDAASTPPGPAAAREGARPGQWLAALSRDVEAGLGSRLTTLAALAVTAGVWALFHPYAGIAIDARIYIGRALADLAPATIGQDLMFRHDGQAGFSAFTLLARGAVAWLGPQRAAASLAFAAMVVWFAAMAALMGRVVGGRLFWAALICLAVLARGYGGSAGNVFGEALAVPRPFAEAGVLGALALVLCGRFGAAWVLLALAGLCHPIMALCGFAVVFVVATAEDRRWLAAPVALGAATLVAAALGAPVAARLFQGIDPAWLSLLRDRNPYLFPSEWPLSVWSRSSVQIGTVIVASALFQGRVRLVLAASAAVAMAAVLTTVVFADLWPSLLIVQAQPWRALWLTAALGAAMLAPCAVRLWTRGGGGRLVLAALAAAWLAPDEPFALAAVAIALVLLALDLRPGGLRIPSRVAYAALAGVGVLALIWLALLTPPLLIVVSAMPASQAPKALIALALRLNMMATVATPVVLAACLSKPRLGPAPRVALGLAVLALALLAWNRDPQVARPGLGPDAGLARMMAAKPGPVEWIDGDTEAWMDAGRANWGSEIQGASIVFSRDQALAWRTRMRTLIGLGLGRETLLRPWMSAGSFQLVRPSLGALDALCRQPDGPAWIVTHVLDGDPAPLGRNTLVWTPPQPAYLSDGPFRLRKVSRYAVQRCESAPGR